MNEEEHPTCPYSGALSKTDRICRSCGGDPSIPSGLVRDEPAGSAEAASEEMSERKYSVFQRFYKLVVSPSEAMEDIGLWPEYSGPLLLVIIRTILAGVAISLAYQKIQWTGDSQIISQAQSFISQVITIAVLIGVVLFFAFWLVKSLLVKVSCDGGSDWLFGTAASVTGYSYLADVIFGVIGLLVVYPLLPSLNVNVSDLGATRQALANFQAQVLWINLTIAIPIGFIGLLWKSYLGGLGTKFGTDEHCSVGRGFLVFLVLALFGWLISFLIRGTI
jgi:hypothetical protein